MFLTFNQIKKFPQIKNKKIRKKEGKKEEIKEEKRTKEEKSKRKIEEQRKEKKRKKNIIFSEFVMHTKKTIWNYLNFVFILNCLCNSFDRCYNEF